MHTDADAWLRSLAGHTLLAEAGSLPPADMSGGLDASGATAAPTRFLADLPEKVAGDIGVFLDQEQLFTDQAVFDALSIPEPDGVPLLLLKARSQLTTGAYMALHAACITAGGIVHPTRPQGGTLPTPGFSADTPSPDLPDFMRLKQLLTDAAFGAPLPHALPTRKQLERCESAAKHGAAVQCEELAAAPGPRTLASALKLRVQEGWAELLTGRAVPADILNVLFAMSQTACDSRFPAPIAEAAAARLSASVRHDAFLAALQAGSGAAALQAYSKHLATDHPFLVQRLAEEETSRPLGSAAGGPAQQAPRLPNDQFCLNWCLGLCQRTDCSYKHECPFRPNRCRAGGIGGCMLLDNGGHLSSLRRQEVRQMIVGRQRALDHFERRPAREQSVESARAPRDADGAPARAARKRSRS